ncbi:hypothetical protein Hanom_Chr04g00379411 [Helianthus anomalus]
MSFMLTSFFRRGPLALKLNSFVFNISKSCLLCPLAVPKLDFFSYIWSCALHMRVFLSFNIPMDY